MADPVGVYTQCLMLFLHQGAEYIHYVFNQIREENLLGYQVNLPAFNFGHIQNLVYEVQQMAAGRVDFCKAILYFIRGIQVGLSNDRHSYDSVHRRADIMGHGGKKVGFGVVGYLGCLAGILQHLFLPHLFHALPGHIKAHAVIRGYSVPAVLGADKAEGQRQDFDIPMVSDHAPFCCRGPAGCP